MVASADDSPTTPQDSQKDLAERGSNRSQRPDSQAFREFIASDWAPRTLPEVTCAAVADHASRRPAEISAAFPQAPLIVPACRLAVPLNDPAARIRPPC